MRGSLQGKRWRLPPEPPEVWVATTVAALAVPAALARFLYARGLRTPEAAAAFLSTPPPPDPRGLPGMREAVCRLAHAVRCGEQVLVYGDYDCDGVCSAALSATALGALGLRVAVHLPSRADGYGMRPETLPAAAAAAGCRLVLAVDNGSTAHAAATAAAAAGIEVIIADHHQLDAVLPPAVAVVNPLRDPGGPFADLAGVGVAWCLAQALGTELGRPVPEAFDLVAIGSIADVVPLRGATRWLVSRGMAAMAEASLRPGVRALLSAAGVARGAPPSARDISYGVAPRLNAPGRMQSPQPAFDLLMARTEAEALAALAVVEHCNRQRQERSAELLATAEAAAASLPPGSRAIVLADARWHPGLVGPAASALLERLRIPVLLAGIDERGVCRGSGRAPAGWDLTGALRRCAEHLVRFGGHAQAAGFEVTLGRLDALRAALAELAPNPATDGDALEDWGLDGRLDPGELSAEVAAALARMGPFGAGNPEPAFLLRAAAVEDTRLLGRDGRHARFRLCASGAAGEQRGVPGIGFGLGPWFDGLTAGGPFDLVVRPVLDRYRGRAELQICVLDLTPSGGDWRAFAAAVQGGLGRRHPDRDALAAAFRRLRTIAREGQGILPPEPELLRRLTPACLPHQEAARAALAIFREVGLIDAQGHISPPEGGGKVDLGGSARFRAAEAARRAAQGLEAWG